MATVHILPLGDAVQHTLPGGWDGHDPEVPPCCGKHRWLTLEAVEDAPDEPCVCIPEIELVPNDDGPDGWLVTHHSADGRELLEQQAASA